MSPLSSCPELEGGVLCSHDTFLAPPLQLLTLSLPPCLKVSLPGNKRGSDWGMLGTGGRRRGLGTQGVRGCRWGWASGWLLLRGWTVPAHFLGVGVGRSSICFSRDCGNSGGEAGVGGSGQSIHTPHVTCPSPPPLALSYGPPAFEQVSSVPMAQGSWQTLGRNQALTRFCGPVGRCSRTFLEQAHGGVLFGMPC